MGSDDPQGKFFKSQNRTETDLLKFPVILLGLYLKQTDKKKYSFFYSFINQNYHVIFPNCQKGYKQGYYSSIQKHLKKNWIVAKI